MYKWGGTPIHIPLNSHRGSSAFMETEKKCGYTDDLTVGFIIGQRCNTIMLVHSGKKPSKAKGRFIILRTTNVVLRCVASVGIELLSI